MTKPEIKAERDIKKEEKWLLNEISVLEKLKQGIEEVLQLKENTKSLTDSLKINNVKRAKIIHSQIEEELRDIPKLQRYVGKGERRRVRYEKKVLEDITSFQKNIEQPTQEKINDLLERIHVYSARVLTELSWRVGRIRQLEQKEDYDLLKKHIQETLEAGKALVVLLEELDKLIYGIGAIIEQKKLTHTILPEVAGFSGYIREGIIKTAHVKSISSLKNYLEKFLGKYDSMTQLGKKTQEKYQKSIDDDLEFLSRVLSEEDIKQLKKISFQVPEGSYLLFLPGFYQPIIIYNLENLPDFSLPGWLFHALPGENLAKISKTGVLQAPLETVIEKKHFFSWKFWEHSGFPQRLIDGISFSFQEFSKYQMYLTGAESHRIRPGEVGGFFIFPLRKVLQPGLILDFRKTIDGYPEVDLRDASYHQYNPILVRDCLMALRKIMPNLSDSLDETWNLFEEAKKNINFFKELHDSIGDEDSIITRESGKQVDFSYHHKRIIASEEKEIFTKSGRFYLKMARSLSGADRNWLNLLIRIINEDRFFEFLLFIFLCYEYKQDAILPPIARFASNQNPVGLDGTIFKIGMDFLDEEKLEEKIFAACCVILTIMKQQPNLFISKSGYSTKDYLDKVNKLNPKKLKKLLKSTMNELIYALSVIVKSRYRSEHPAVVEISKGILFLNTEFSDQETLDRLIRKRITIFAQFGSGGICGSIRSNKVFRQDQLEFFFKSVLPLNNFQKGKEFYECYLYLDSKNRLTAQCDDLVDTGKGYQRIKRVLVLD